VAMECWAGLVEVDRLDHKCVKPFQFFKHLPTKRYLMPLEIIGWH
jgi:hypothetical protein